MEAALPDTFIDSTSLSFALLVALAAIVTFLRLTRSGRRGKALREIAHQLNLTMEGEDWSSSTRAPRLGAPLFAKGEEKKFENIISGPRAGMTANFFDYSFRSRGSENSQTVAAFTQDVWMPTFELAPPGISGRLNATASRKGIEFDFSPEFSKRFRLLGAEEERVRKLFTQGVVFFLEGIDSGARWSLEGADFTLIIYRQGETVRPADYAAFVEATTELATGFLGYAR